MQLAGATSRRVGLPLLDFNGDGLKDVAWMKAYPEVVAVLIRQILLCMRQTADRFWQ